MLIHEYQAKQKLQEYKIPVPPKGALITRDEEIIQVLRKTETPVAVIKAQVHAGGRGKAGGVVVVESLLDGITAVRRLWAQNWSLTKRARKANRLMPCW